MEVIDNFVRNRYGCRVRWSRMSSIEEKRVYSTSAGKTDVFVATGVGIARVACSGGLVGGFELIHQCTGTDITAADGRLAAATEKTVLVWRDGEFVSSGFSTQITQSGAHRAVGFHEGLIAAGPDRIARYTDTWHDLRVPETEHGPLTINAIDGSLVAAEEGVYRITGSELSPVGLERVRAVSGAPVPLAGTETGLYQLKNGWETVLDGTVHCVESDGTRVHVATDDGLFVRLERDGTHTEWEQVSLPVSERIAGVAYGESTYVVTVDGTFLIGAEGEWRARSLGLPDVCGLAVP